MRKRLVILGGGRKWSGTALLGKLTKDYDVRICIKQPKDAKEKEQRRSFLNNELNLRDEKHTESKILNADISSWPGIPDKVALVKRVREAGIKVVSEIEFASVYTDATLVAITGSNGKTTTGDASYFKSKI
jgi:UDP-N-acetylmuramoylalanine--D-glutamate ligase